MVIVIVVVLNRGLEKLREEMADLAATEMENEWESPGFTVIEELDIQNGNLGWEGGMKAL